MLHISREKFQLLPEGKILKREDYCAYLEAENAVNHAYRENDKLIQHASQLCNKLVADTNIQIKEFIGTANARAQELIDEANKNAEKIIQEANAKSQQILDEALDKRTQIFEEAKKYYENEAKRGYDDGYATGKAEMAKQLAELAVKNADNVKYLENSVASLVVKALQRIIGEVDRRELIVNIVRQALKAVKNQQEAILKVSPKDSQAVRDNLKEILSDGVVDYLEVVADSRLKPGTCILETDLGVIDASLDVQVEAIIGAFKKVMSKDSAGAVTADGEGNQSDKVENTAEEKLKKVASEVENESDEDGEAESQDRETEISAEVAEEEQASEVENESDEDGETESQDRETEISAEVTEEEQASEVENESGEDGEAESQDRETEISDGEEQT
ncbi:MAG: HrpE/YscL family type III secretion apparatus protein [Puniceicoccales bacterium]|jgi:type III secretion protein L|nr:HrpE/YscL family type III secretion apparatus protein [Puniceicoccales bacterium]